MQPTQPIRQEYSLRVPPTTEHPKKQQPLQKQKNDCMKRFLQDIGTSTSAQTLENRNIRTIQ